MRKKQHKKDCRLKNNRYKNHGENNPMTRKQKMVGATS